MKDWKSYEDAADKGPMQLAVKIIASLFLLGILVGVVGYATSWFGEAAQVAKEEFGLREALKKYEWFKDASAELDKKQADIKVYSSKLTSLAEAYKDISRREWPRTDMEQMSIWQAEVAGVKAQIDAINSDSIDDYLAKVTKVLEGKYLWWLIGGEEYLGKDKDGNVVSLKVGDYVMSKTVNVTDAQSYITLPRYREILVGLGRWTPIHQKMYPKLMNSTATAEEIAFIMQPIKPFYFGQMKMMPNDNLIRPFQIKNSEYLLIPQMVESSATMKKLHDHMISNGIGFVGFESAIKVGGSGKANSDLSDIENATVFNLENKNYGLQQETPEHYLDSSSLYGSQIRKLILSDIDKDASFHLFGKDYSRDELISLYHDLVVTDLKEAFGEVQEALSSNEKIYELLINEIREINI